MIDLIWQLFRPLQGDTMKFGLQVNLQLSQLERPRKKLYYKKALQTFYGQKDHLPWKTGQEKSKSPTSQ